MPDTPVLETLADMTTASVDHFTAPPDALILIRLAALIAVDAPALSYLSHLGVASDAGVTSEDVQNVLIAVAPIVGTARVVSAATNIARAFGFAVAAVDVALADDDA